MNNREKPNKRAAVLWTGGKDCSLSLYLAGIFGYKIAELVTFVPKKGVFLAHPLHFMKYQAKALSLPHRQIVIKAPFMLSYKSAIRSLKEVDKIDALVAGDIAEVAGHPNWIRECCEESDIEALTPLWGIQREEVLEKLLSLGFKVIFSCVKKPWFSEDWLGRELDQNAVYDLRILGTATSLDICGEQGEYHTLVLDGPIFGKTIAVKDYSRCSKNSIMYLDVTSVVLDEKL